MSLQQQTGAAAPRPAGAKAGGRASAFLAVIYICAVLLGAALMAFEILVSRMLTPYFGGDLYNWSAVISVVLFAMMVGYFIGGRLVDWRPSLNWAALFAAIAGLWFLTLDFYADALFDWLSRVIEDVHIGVLIGAFIAQMVPVTALGAYSPIAVRVALNDIEHAGRVSGEIYAVSTIGNVIGTLGAAFYLIGTFPLSASVTAMGLVCFACAAALWAAETYLRPQEAAPSSSS
ncbi:MAG: fused MFS/spermidine synthase [Pseudomonadota bacterium]